MHQRGGQVVFLLVASVAVGCVKGEVTGAKAPDALGQGNASLRPDARPPNLTPLTMDMRAAEKPLASGAATALAVVNEPAPAEAAAPKDLVAHLRIRNARKLLLSTLAELGLPTELLDKAMNAAALSFVRETLRNDVDPEIMAPLLDWSVPVDMVVALQGDDVDHQKGLACFSVGVTSLQGALAAARTKPRQRGAGFWQLDTSDGKGSMSCGLFAAAGMAPARLVCGDRLRDVAALGPWLATSLAKREIPGGEVHAELQLRGLLDKIAPEVTLKSLGLPLLAATQKLGVPAFDEALMEAASALRDETPLLLSDLNSFEFDAGVDPAHGLTAVGKASFAGAQSWLVKRMIDGPTGQSGAPEIFGRAPKTSSSVAYSYSSDPAQFVSVVRVLRGLAGGALEHLKFGTPADRSALVGLLRLSGKKFTPTMSAFGRFEAEPSAALTLPGLVADVVGWSIAGVDEESTAARAWLNDLVKAYNRPVVQGWLKAQLADNASSLPSLKIVPAPTALGVGALDVELKFSNIPDPLAELAYAKYGRPVKSIAAPSLTFHLLVMPDGGRTFIGFSPSRDKLAALMVKSKGNVAGPETLSTLPQLSGFRSETHRAGAFFTVKSSLAGLGALGSFAAIAPPAVGAAYVKFQAAMARLPHGGQTPILITSDGSSGKRPSVEVGFSLPHTALQDLGVLIKAVLDEVGGLGTLVP